jgi:hypothetical protein
VFKVIVSFEAQDKVLADSTHPLNRVLKELQEGFETEESAREHLVVMNELAKLFGLRNYVATFVG